MPQKYESRQVVRENVENEGIGYFVNGYVSPGMMPDDELEEAFMNARNAVVAFEKLLGIIE